MAETTTSAPPPVTAPARPRAGRAVLAYATAVYLFLLGVLAYSAGFFAGFAVPKGIDQGSRWPVLPRWPSTWPCSGCSPRSTP